MEPNDEVKLAEAEKCALGAVKTVLERGVNTLFIELVNTVWGFELREPFLRDLRTMMDQYHAKLVVDEIMTGERWEVMWGSGGDRWGPVGNGVEERWGAVGSGVERWGVAHTCTMHTHTHTHARTHTRTRTHHLTCAQLVGARQHSSCPTILVSSRTTSL